MSTEAAGTRELARARLRDIERYRDLWFKYGEMLAEVSRLQDEIEKCDREALRGVARLWNQIEAASQT